jgi:hypothetical protein
MKVFRSIKRRVGLRETRTSLNRNIVLLTLRQVLMMIVILMIKIVWGFIVNRILTSQVVYQLEVRINRTRTIQTLN